MVRAALADPGDAPERELFYFDDALPHGYEAWCGVRTLPKLELGLARAPPADGRGRAHWLDAPYSLDGWRIDVANMTGRRRRDRRQREVVAHRARRPPARIRS